MNSYVATYLSIPDGWVSKNLIFALSSFANMLLCSLFADDVRLTANDIACIPPDRNINPHNPPYTLIKILLEVEKAVLFVFCPSTLQLTDAIS